MKEKKKMDDERDERHERYTTELLTSLTDKFLGKLEELFGGQRADDTCQTTTRKRRHEESIRVPVQMMKD